MKSNNLPVIAFINPPGPSKLYRSMVCTFISKANYIWQPQDFINLSAHVPQDYDLRFIDCSLNNIGADRLFDQIRLCRPRLCVIALSSIVFDQDLEFLKALRSHFADMKCLVLGDILLEEVFREKVLEYADGLLLNSMDIDLENYLNHDRFDSPNAMQKGITNRPEPKDNTKKIFMGIPRHEVFINKKYRFPFVKSSLYSTVSTQFGCPFHCNYCSWSKISVTYRDYTEVLKEIEKIKSLGVRDIFFGDPSFGFPRENAEKLLEGMIDRDLSLRWCCYANPALLDSNFLKLMKKAGCQTAIIGVDDEDLESLKERYQRNVSESTLLEFNGQCQKLGIQVCGDFIIGLNSDENAIDRMVQFAGKLKLDYASFNVFTVLLGSIAREKLVKEGKIDPYTRGSETSGTMGEGHEELVRLRNLAIKKFYMNPAYLGRRILKIKSLPELKIQLEEMVALFSNYFKSNSGFND